MRDDIGAMLPLRARDPSLEVLVNDSGMSGTGGRIHLHSNKTGDMYKGPAKDFIFDIGHMDKLGKLYIWNYNAPGDTESGLRRISVSASEDGLCWTSPIEAELSMARGDPELMADEHPVDFAGLPGRYVRIRAESGWGGDGYGLSQVRLFRYRHPLAPGAAITCTPPERYAPGQPPASPQAYNLTCGCGLSDFRRADALMDNDPGHMFCLEGRGAAFDVDMKGMYPISRLVIWNYNDPDHLDRGVREVKLWISDDFLTWRPLGDHTLERAEGLRAEAPALSLELAGGTRGRYLRLEGLSNYGGEFTGLAGISVFLGEGWVCEDAPDYTALFSRYNGWSGADGIYTVNLDGKDRDPRRDPGGRKTFFVFSDTIISDVDPVTKLRGPVYMPNNTCAVMTGSVPDCGKIRFFWPEREGPGANLAPPVPIPSVNPGRLLYYWLGDAFVSGEYLYVFTLRIDNISAPPGFQQNGVDLARYRLCGGEVDLNSQTIIEDGSCRLCDISRTHNRFFFGGAVFQNTRKAGALDPDGFIYVYGYNDLEGYGRRLIVSRVRPERVEDFSTYEYLAEDGRWVGHVPDMFMALADDVAPELSVTQIQNGRHAGEFLLVNSHLTDTPVIVASLAKSPFDRFAQKRVIFVHDTCTAVPGRDNTTYNAKAHPALSDVDELMLTYNVNGPDCFKYADIYRPRFLRLALTAPAAGREEE